MKINSTKIILAGVSIASLFGGCATLGVTPDSKTLDSYPKEITTKENLESIKKATVILIDKVQNLELAAQKNNNVAMPIVSKEQQAIPSKLNSMQESQIKTIDEKNNTQDAQIRAHEAQIQTLKQSLSALQEQASKQTKLTPTPTNVDPSKYDKVIKDFTNEGGQR
jgi:hypothetical protein